MSKLAQKRIAVWEQSRETKRRANCGIRESSPAGNPEKTGVSFVLRGLDFTWMIGHNDLGTTGKESMGTICSRKVLGRRFCGCVTACWNSCIILSMWTRSWPRLWRWKMWSFLVIWSVLKMRISKRWEFWKSPSCLLVAHVGNTRGDEYEGCCYSGLRGTSWAPMGLVGSWWWMRCSWWSWCCCGVRVWWGWQRWEPREGALRICTGGRRWNWWKAVWLCTISVWSNS